jgi:hypothetical protein
LQAGGQAIAPLRLFRFLDSRPPISEPPPDPMKRPLFLLLAALAAPFSAAAQGPGATVIAERTRFFATLDLNDDGFLDRDEASALRLPAPALRTLFRKVDRNLDRKISLAEFLAVPVKRMPITIPGDPIVDPPPPPPPADPLSISQVLGLPLEEAIALAVREGRPWRVIIPGHFYTMEYLENRVNFRVTNGIVTDVTRG